MSRALAGLRSKRSLKEIARELAYEHPADLSRAFRTYFGASTREVRATLSHPPGNAPLLLCDRERPVDKC
jgi:AraC-like DNA-binding protein